VLGICRRFRAGSGVTAADRSRQDNNSCRMSAAGTACFARRNVKAAAFAAAQGIEWELDSPRAVNHQTLTI
jgi:hypothetical protein